MLKEELKEANIRTQIKPKFKPVLTLPELADKAKFRNVQQRTLRVGEIQTYKEVTKIGNHYVYKDSGESFFNNAIQGAKLVKGGQYRVQRQSTKEVLFVNTTIREPIIELLLGEGLINNILSKEDFIDILKGREITIEEAYNRANQPTTRER